MKKGTVLCEPDALGLGSDRDLFSRVKFVLRASFGCFEKCLGHIVGLRVDIVNVRSWPRGGNCLEMYSLAGKWYANVWRLFDFFSCLT